MIPLTQYCLRSTGPLFFLIFSSTVWADFRADFAVYDPGLTQKEDGVWKEEVSQLKSMFELHQWTYEVIGFKEINNGKLGSGEQRNYKALIMPGGYAVPRLHHLYPEGQNNIEEFVKSGGGYVGFCAGSYFATPHVTWAEETSDPKGLSNQPEDYIHFNNYQSPHLFPGQAIGPLGWAPWKISGNWTNPTGMTPARMNTDSDIVKQIQAPTQILFYYFGGPYFELPKTKNPGDFKVWATAQMPSDASGNPQGDDKPTIIEFSKGQGEVVLFSYHPVILASEQSSNSTLQLDSENNYQSWNVLNASLQVVTHSKITPLPRLKHKG